MSDKISAKLIEKRAKILGAIASECTKKSLEAEVGKEIELIIDGESDEHEYLLSARKLLWAPEIDGEFYVNDRSQESALDYGVIYKAKVTELIGTILTATVDNA